jgi:hypothetical protein
LKRLKKKADKMIKTSEHKAEKAEQKEEDEEDEEEEISGMNDNDDDDDDEEKVKNIHRRLWFQSDQYTFLRTGSSLKKQFIETNDDEKPEMFKDIDAILLKNESYLPFICFKSFPSTWAVKNCNHTIPHPQRLVAIDILFFIFFKSQNKFLPFLIFITNALYICNFSSVEFLDSLAALLIQTRIFPYHLIHIEHCHKCESHAMTTRHQPGEVITHTPPCFLSPFPPTLGSFL